MVAYPDTRSVISFFLLQVVSYPYKLNNLLSFLKIISAEQLILKDFIQIIRLELVSGRMTDLTDIMNLEHAWWGEFGAPG